MVFIILAGCMAWLNFQFAERLYDRWSKPEMLYRRDKWPGMDDPESKVDPINATLFLAASFGGLSIWTFIASAAEVFKALPGV